MPEGFKKEEKKGRRLLGNFDFAFLLEITVTLKSLNFEVTKLCQFLCFWYHLQIININAIIWTSAKLSLTLTHFRLLTYFNSEHVHFC